MTRVLRSLAAFVGLIAFSLSVAGTLLIRRDSTGPEPHEPNTIYSSCADGTRGKFHDDESNDRIKISTTDGSPFAPGKTVKIEATVWASFWFYFDRLDLYYAADATSPAWTLITTLTPDGRGERTLSAVYTLPSGSLQAVRAHFGYDSSLTFCAGRSDYYDDHDDLIFAVGVGAGDTQRLTTLPRTPGPTRR